MPFIFLDLYNQVLRFATGILEGAFSPKRTMQWQDWEQFVAEFTALRNNLLVQLGHKTATLREIYRGASGQTPCSQRSPVEWGPNNLIINGASAKFADSFIIREGVESQDLIIGHQKKWNYKSKGAITIRDIQMELAKNRKPKPDQSNHCETMTSSLLYSQHNPLKGTQPTSQTIAF
ncbi:hypothetical protein BC936DRAFT_142988 [Jimgerdemannia flammicorona]|uniref:Uncharacterized protein n=1 Tax=Jimgerdemannia flammicorona TaxID=994334 RepID=A0A433DEH0_9FUNG|nr:hypothetical protein BC936DRAFT_142988 [Jimgerdemannia flammicorona]